MILESDATMSPQETSPMKPAMSVRGIDIAKRVFHAVGMDNTGKIVFRKRLARNALMPFIATLPPVLIGMEACGGAHDWARRVREHHHDVKPMSPPFFKPSCKPNKKQMRDRTTIIPGAAPPPL